jgi:hypothetical protein
MTQVKPDPNLWLTLVFLANKSDSNSVQPGLTFKLGTYHSRTIPEGIAEASQKFLPKLPNLFVYELN